MCFCLPGETVKRNKTKISLNLLVFVQIQALPPWWTCVWGCWCSSHWFAVCHHLPDPRPESAGDAATSRNPQHPQDSTRYPRSALSSTWPSSKVPRATTDLCYSLSSKLKYRFGWSFQMDPHGSLYVSWLLFLYVWPQWNRTNNG